jgi:myo-inositol-1(or 4)-monophosphatase
MNQQLSSLCAAAQDLIQHTATFILEELGKVTTQQVETKALNSLVSYVDKTAEQRLTAGLSAILPGSVFLTEEETVAQEKGEWRWVIDPLDGTTNFLHQLPCFAISVALEHQGEVVVGIVHEVTRNETFSAWKGSGVLLNGKPVKVSATPSIDQSLVATGFPYYDFEKMTKYLQAMRWMMEHTRGIRRWGAAAVDLAYVACGRYDLFFEYHLQPWDIAAGAFLVQEAGGKVSDFQGGNGFWDGSEIVAANPQVYLAGQAMLKEVFY